MSDPPPRDPLLSLHDRLLQGDRVASEEMCRLLLSPLAEKLHRRYPDVDEQTVADGVIDALLDYCSCPSKFDATRNIPLDRYLALAARRNALNTRRGEQRRKRREKEVGSRKREADVALDPVAGNISREEEQAWQAKRQAMLDALEDPVDKQILVLQLDGVRDTAAFAAVMNIAHLHPDQQRAEVKRRKDRIKVFLRRKGLWA